MTSRSRARPFTPQRGLRDLERYVVSRGFAVSEAAKQVFLQAERIAEENNVGSPLLNVFLLGAIRAVPHFRAAVEELGGNLSAALQLLETDIRERRDEHDQYSSQTRPYSSKRSRDLVCRKSVVDRAILAAEAHGRKQIFDIDVIEGVLQAHELDFPAINNGIWVDAGLHTPFNTLSHILGVWHAPLSLRFDALRGRLGIAPELMLGRSHIDAAPARLRPSLLRLLQDHPHYDRNCFVIMPFTKTRWHAKIHRAIKQTLQRLHLNGLRADDCPYDDDLFTNVETYLHACSFGIAVFDRLVSDNYNPNVTLEVGYLIGLGRPVCLLKEKTLPKLPSDLVGRLYREFDVQDIPGTIPREIENWLYERRIILSPSDALREVVSPAGQGNCSRVPR